MKKTLALLLVITLLLSLAACGGTAETTATDASVPTMEDAAEPVETEPASPYTAQSEIDIALRNGEAPVLSFPSNDAYTVVMKGLGFNEVDFTNHVIGDERGYYDKEGNRTSTPIPSATVHNIQFLDDMVRVEFSWYELGDKHEEDGWVLYCTKADSVADISGLNPADYDGCNGFDFNELRGEINDFVDWWKYDYIKVFGKRAFVDAYYYPDSGNLYNVVKVYEEEPSSAPCPQILCKDEEVAEDYLLNSNFELTFVDDYPIVTSEFAIICDDEVKTYKYRVGMSLAAWAASEFNTDGWILGPDNMLFSPDHEYWLKCTDWDMEKVGYEDVEGDGVFFLGNRSTAAHKNAVEKSMDTNTATAYLVDWQTALLPTGFAVVGESSEEEEIAYGMYDMAYGCESGEVFKIYMRNVHPSLLADVKVYAVPNNGERMIPDNAMCFAFENVETLAEKDARFGITMAEATYHMAADPNVTPDGDFAFAITYRDKLVYWIHVPGWAMEE